jgi:hypothetical protein
MDREMVRLAELIVGNGKVIIVARINVLLGRFRRHLQ